MAWIVPADVLPLIRDDGLCEGPHILGVIDLAQGLAELEIGPQATPSAGLKAVMVMIVARLWQVSLQAEANPLGASSQTVGPFSMTVAQPSVLGLGLTNREVSLLKKAVGRTGAWVQPLSRSGDTLETAGKWSNELADALDPIDILAGAQAPITQR